MTDLRSADSAPPAPSLAEQHRIVSLLDEAFAGLPTANANAEKNLKNARQLFETYLNSIFTESVRKWSLALQLHFSLEVSTARLSLVSASPE
jgi:hypothetical protein